MRIAVMGTGAVGGYFGARLALAGAQVHFIARGAHLAAMRADGLRIESPEGDLYLPAPEVTDEPGRVGPVDVVLFAVKLWDTEAAATAIKPLLGPETAVISLQNGVTGLATLQEILGEGHVAGGTAHIAATIAAPGVIRHTGRLARITYGELDGRHSARLQALHRIAGRAGFDCVLTEHILAAIWEKFAFLAPFSGITSLVRQPAGVIRAEPATRALFRDAVAEVAGVAAAHGVALSGDLVDRLTTLLDGVVPEMRSSMLQDLDRGGRIELPWLSGAVARLGAEKNVPTPVHRLISAALAPYVQGPPSLSAPRPNNAS